MIYIVMNDAMTVHINDSFVRTTMLSEGTAYRHDLSVHNPEGYTHFDITDGKFTNPQQYYFRRDHLGSNMAVWNATRDTTVQRTWYYASGTPMSNSTGQSAQSYKYNGKEFVEIFGNNTYDYGFRGYHAITGRFTTMDPLAEKFYDISPYAYCGGNPIRYIDERGLAFKTRFDNRVATRLQKIAYRRINKLKKNIDNNLNRLGKNLNNSRRVVNLQSSIRDMQNQITKLTELNNGINKLKTSKTIYTYNIINTNKAILSRNIKTEEIIINTTGSIGNMAHETTHAIQYDSNRIRFEEGSETRMIGDIYSCEVEAYQTEYSIEGGIDIPSEGHNTPNRVDDIDIDWVMGININGVKIYDPTNYDDKTTPNDEL